MNHICNDSEGFMCWSDEWLQSQEANLHLRAAAVSESRNSPQKDVKDGRR